MKQVSEVKVSVFLDNIHRFVLILTTTFQRIAPLPSSGEIPICGPEMEVGCCLMDPTDRFHLLTEEELSSEKS
jgi:hypothetical protein